MKILAKRLFTLTFLLYAVSKLLKLVNRYIYPISDEFIGGFLLIVLIAAIITEVIIKFSRGRRNVD